MLSLLVTGYLFIGVLIGLNIMVRLKSIRKTRMLIFTSIVLFWLPGAILMLIDVVMGRCK